MLSMSKQRERGRERGRHKDSRKRKRRIESEYRENGHPIKIHVVCFWCMVACNPRSHCLLSYILDPFVPFLCGSFYYSINVWIYPLLAQSHQIHQVDVYLFNIMSISNSILREMGIVLIPPIHVFPLEQKWDRLDIYVIHS